jgi:hypothetical protein
MNWSVQIEQLNTLLKQFEVTDRSKSLFNSKMAFAQLLKMPLSTM